MRSLGRVVIFQNCKPFERDLLSNYGLPFESLRPLHFTNRPEAIPAGFFNVRNFSVLRESGFCADQVIVTSFVHTPVCGSSALGLLETSLVTAVKLGGVACAPLSSGRL